MFMLPAASIPTLHLAFMFPSGGEWLVILILGLLIFGKRLPEVGRSVGKTIVEFKKGIKDVQDEIEQASNNSNSSSSNTSNTSSAPLKPYDKRLGGDEQELRRLQDQGDAEVRNQATSQSQQQQAQQQPPSSSSSQPQEHEPSHSAS